MRGEEEIKSRVVGVDISINNTTYAIVDIRGNIIAEDNFPTSDYSNISDFVTKLSESILQQMEENGGYETIRSIGVSCPSASFLTGSIVNAPNLPWKGNIPLAAMLRDRLGLAVGIANDAHVSAMGEYAYGSAHGMKNFIVISLGVGLGSCFYSEGHEHQGFGGYAGEFGHTCVHEFGRKCACGKEGCLEAYCAANGIVQTAQELLAATDAPSLLRDQERLSPRIIASCCSQGDAIALEVYRKMGSTLGLGLANYASLLSPQAIILTGGISHAAEWFLDSLRESFERNVFQTIRDKVLILVSKLNDHEREVLGASALAWEIPEYSLFR